jgi:hypothetical protein
MLVSEPVSMVRSCPDFRTLSYSAMFTHVDPRSAPCRRRGGHSEALALGSAKFTGMREGAVYQGASCEVCLREKQVTRTGFDSWMTIPMPYE